MKKEFKVILYSVLNMRSEKQEKELYDLFSGELDWTVIAGLLVNHRLGGYFLRNLPKDLYKKVPKEIKKNLELLQLAQKEQIKEISKVASHVFEDFDKENVRYAALKGLVLNASLYEPGDRRSNDSDILVYEGDLDKIDKILRDHGYIQTLLHNGEYKEATRREKLIQRMNYHDLVPYVKKCEKDFLDMHEFDINFHFDSKNNDVTLKVIEHGLREYENDFYKVKGLDYDTNLVYLCVHFFREGTNTLWTSGKRDLVLYKLVDVYNAFKLCEEKNLLDSWSDLVKEFNVQKAAYYTLYVLNEFYEDEKVKELMNKLKVEDESYIFDVVVEGKNITMKREKTFVEDAFDLVY